MPKRPKTPPVTADDETKFFTVVYPYPAYADMEKVAEQKAFARWLACCVGSDRLISIFHKPSSPTMLIIEVLRSSTNDWGHLLGLHKWSEFLRDPTDDEKTKETKIFYCTLSYGREVQKHGWNRIDVQDSWFLRWDVTNDHKIKYPYPRTSYCDTPPASDKTYKPLCRPLPVSDFPRLPLLVPPVPVGTQEWQATRGTKDINDQNIRGRRVVPRKIETGTVSKIPASLNHSAKPQVVAPIPSTGNAWLGGPYNLTPFADLWATAPLSASSPSTGNESNFPLTPPGLPAVPNRDTSWRNSGEPDVQALDQRFSAWNIQYRDEEEDDWEVHANDVQEVHDEKNGSLTQEAEEYEYVRDEPMNHSSDPVCPYHGHSRQCQKGICREWKIQEAKRRKEEGANKKREEKVRKGTLRGNPTNKNGRKQGTKSGYDSPHHAPPSGAERSRSRPKPPYLVSGNGSPPDQSPAVSETEQTELRQPILPPTTVTRPARGRKMNTPASNSTVTHNIPWRSTVRSLGPSATSSKQASPASSNGGWSSTKSPAWGGAPSVRGLPNATINNSNKGFLSPHSNWGRSSRQTSRSTSASGDIQVGEDAGSWVDRKTSGWDWAGESDDQKGVGDETLKDAESVAESSTGGWGHPPSLW